MSETNGKGDKRRPLTVPYSQYSKNWDKVFKKKKVVVKR
jgi:hypothetical protein